MMNKEQFMEYQRQVEDILKRLSKLAEYRRNETNRGKDDKLMDFSATSDYKAFKISFSVEYPKEV